MQQRPPRPGTSQPGTLARLFRRPQVVLPAAVVLGVVALAFGVQPSGAANAPAASATAVAIAATATPTTVPKTPTRAPSATAAAANASATPSSDVAGVRATPAASPTPEVDLAQESTQCGSLQETAVAVTVEQTIGGVAVRATRVATYPVAYFKCILMATGGKEAMALAASVAKAERDGATHAVLIDLWFTNAAKDFGQVNLRTASLAAAGGGFGPLATLGGRSDVVVSSGQGRAVTLVVTIKNTLTASTGPMTLSLDGPLAGGKQVPGKYQLFLPTP